MDELTIDGKTYLSSKRAAALTGYAKDYVGQLCREGRVEARLVGRSWYVYEPSIMKHRFDSEVGEVERNDKDQEEVATQTVEAIEDEAPQEPEEEPSEISNVQAVWEAPRYESEEVKELPLEDSVENEEVKTEAVPAVEGVEEIETAWKEWFSSSETTGQNKEEVEIEEEKPIESASEEEKKVPIQIVREEKPAESTYTAPRAVDIGNLMERPRGTIKKKKNYLIIKAVLIGIMLISIAIAMVGTGAGSTLGGVSKEDISFIKFLEGINEIK